MSEDDTIMEKLELSMAKVVKKLGEGLIDPVPYDTAWVARVPQTGNLKLPAFPLCLQWLRDNQLEDGSWGATKPFSPFSSTLNTLAAIIALAQWDNSEDKARIERGIKALWNLVAHFSTEVLDGVAFEIILPALEQEARKFGLAVPYEHYRIDEIKALQKLGIIHSLLKTHGNAIPGTWWHSLEILESNLSLSIDNEQLGFISSMLGKDGSLAASPSATAFVLRSNRLKGVNIPEAENYLKNIYALFQGGIPHTYPIDIFELAFSLDLFLQAGFSAKHSLLELPIRRLANLCISLETIGFSSKFRLPDADDMAVALHVLHQAGYELSTQHLLKFFNGDHMSTYIGETSASLSTNANALRTLRSVQDTSETHVVIHKVADYVEALVTSEKQVFNTDKWHLSPYYGCYRAVFALNGLKDDVVMRCLDFFMESQNPDGGWGVDGFSTAEETSYVSLALCYGMQNGFVITRSLLERANEFLIDSAKNHSDAQLWVAKVLYRPALVSESAILAARFALINALGSGGLDAPILKPDYLLIEGAILDGEDICCGYLPRVASDFDISLHSDLINMVRKYTVERLATLKLIKTQESVMRTMIPEGSLFIIREHNVTEEYLKSHALLTMAITIYDNILDENWRLFRNDPDILYQVFRTFLKILQGNIEDIDGIPSIDYPKFLPLCRLFNEVSITLLQKPHVEGFLNAIKEDFEFSVIDIKNRIDGKKLSSDEFLELAKNTSYYSTLYYFQCVFENIDLSSLKDYKHFIEYLDCAKKSARLILDIFSFERDLRDGSQFDNYVLLRQEELNHSLKDSFNATVRLCNKLITKMFRKKKIMQEELASGNDDKSLKAIHSAEKLLQGILDWASRNERYSLKTKNVLSVKG